MSNRTAEIQRILSSEDEEFRKWIEEHHECESRLSELSSKREVTTEFALGGIVLLLLAAAGSTRWSARLP